MIINNYWFFSKSESATSACQISKLKKFHAIFQSLFKRATSCLSDGMSHMTKFSVCINFRFYFVFITPLIFLILILSNVIFIQPHTEMVSRGTFHT